MKPKMFQMALGPIIYKDTNIISFANNIHIFYITRKAAFI